MCEPATLGAVSLGATVVGAGLGAFGQFQAGQANAAAARYQAGVARNNQILAERQRQEAIRRGEIGAQDALERGRESQARVAIQARQLVGRQRAVLAANGIDLGSQSVVDILSDTGEFARLDQETVLNQAEREALAIRTGALDTATALQQQAFNAGAQSGLLRTQASEASRAGTAGAFSTLLTGAGSVASKWYNFRQEGVF